ncbi:MAG: succinylglutamate desuccinylase/aspartoacylase family protein [Flavobacteriales bacterium]|nr:succinylglutamate desuccinylase/aspartoacylase family protein [Flavobacteriales bacterium]
MREDVIEITSFNEKLSVERIIGNLGNATGNTILFLGGVHGNETSGIAALHEVFGQLKKENKTWSGRAMAIVGNMEASRLGQRYVYKDLNRIWTREIIDDLHYGRLDTRHTEFAELVAVYKIISELIKTTQGQLYVVDLHTTSSPTIPFIVTNNEARCKAFTNHFPMPVISGLTGFLDGTLLSYINDLGHVGLAYEAGQHNSHQSFLKHESFIWLSLYHSGICTDIDQRLINLHKQTLEEELVTRNNNFKLISRYKIKEDEAFKMNLGYTNFQKIFEGEELAQNQFGKIKSPYDGFIFMPLYQSQGDDGFFIVKPEQTE